MPAGACACARLNPEPHALPDEIDSSRVRSLCLIDNSIDDILHGASLGAADVQASLLLWLDRHSRRVEQVIERLLEQGFTVCLTSDHGHVEACGIGQPREGLLVQSRCKRARVYDQRAAALQWHDRFPDTVLWEDDGLLPADAHVLMPKDRSAFTQYGETVVTHGGLTLDEVVVPLITITRNGE